MELYDNFLIACGVVEGFTVSGGILAVEMELFLVSITKVQEKNIQMIALIDGFCSTLSQVTGLLVKNEMFQVKCENNVLV